MTLRTANRLCWALTFGVCVATSGSVTAMLHAQTWALFCVALCLGAAVDLLLLCLVLLVLAHVTVEDQ